MPKRAYSVGAGASRADPEPPLKPVDWVGSALEDLRACPAEVRDVVGYALFLAQQGTRHLAAKRLKGVLTGLVEIVDDFNGNTYRAVYTAKLAGVIYALHVFQKKSTHGIATPRHELELITQRLHRARQHHAAYYPATEKER
jgi:phage-related protein